jgi:hypothetical protein
VITGKHVLDAMLVHCEEHGSAIELAERRGLDYTSLYETLAPNYGDKTPTIIGFIAVGIDLERKAQTKPEKAVNCDYEPTASRDEFLTSLPEHYGGKLNQEQLKAQERELDAE